MAARCLMAVRQASILVVPVGKRPHPWRSQWRGGGLHDAPDDDAVGEHVEVVGSKARFPPMPR
jgi:hypothetical protein